MRLSAIKSFQNEFFSLLKENLTFKAIFVISFLISLNLVFLFLLNSTMMNGLEIGLTVGAVLVVFAAVSWCLYIKGYCRKLKNSFEGEPILPITHRNGTVDAGNTQKKIRKVDIIDFYKNKMPSEPNGEYISIMLTHWYGNYELLERKHDYIQWLFPNRNVGVNPHAPLLTDETAKIIRETPELKNRMKEAFEMMLNFYGMRLVHDEFSVAENYAERFRELNQWGNHNFLRISRILLALKECGHNSLMRPWLEFLSHHIYESKYLSEASSSFEKHWINTLDAEDRIKLEQYLKTLQQYSHE